MKRLLTIALALVLLLCSACAGGGVTTLPPLETGTQPPETTAGSKADGTETEAPKTEAPDQGAETKEQSPETQPQQSLTPTEISLTEPATQAPIPVDPQPVDPWSLMDEASFEQGSYTDNLGNQFTYSYGLPKINADTEGARAINEAIENTFGKMLADAHDSMDQGLSLPFSHIGYRGEVWEDVLTLVVIVHWDWDYTDYGIYCYETTTGRWLDTPALLEKMGISQEEFRAACKEQFTLYFQNMYATLPVEQRSMYGYDQALERAGSEEFVSLDLMAYPAKGDLVVIAPIPSLAGADHYFHEIYLGIGGVG